MTTFLHRHALATIVLAQLFGTSLWFSVNGVGLSLSRDLGFSEADLGRLTLTVQAGFILGTLSIAASGLADRFRASRIFAVSCLLGALVNAAFVLASASFATSLWAAQGVWVLWWLLPGPILGLWAVRRLL